MMASLRAWGCQPHRCSICSTRNELNLRQLSVMQSQAVLAVHTLRWVRFLFGYYSLFRRRWGHLGHKSRAYYAPHCCT